MAQPFDSVLVVSFGGPEGPGDVVPFLENVLRGRNVPRERLLEVAKHYELFGGVSPLNAQNRALIAALVNRLETSGPPLPVYWGNRNWHPLLPDTLTKMARDGVHRALGFFTSAYSSYSSCRQYRDDIERARTEVGAAAPTVEKLRAFFNHPGFIEPMIERVGEALIQIPPDRRTKARFLYTAHSIPMSMADHCQYTAQFTEAARLVTEGLGRTGCQVAYQSRSGPPSQPWLGPDVNDALRQLAGDGGSRDIVVVPLGFLSDHIEILYDLDVEAHATAQEVGLNLVRAGTVGSHPQFVEMIRELILERTEAAPRRSLGAFGPSHDACPSDCCLHPSTRAR